MVPEAVKKVDPLPPSTPEQLVDQVVQSSTKQQIVDLFREYGSVYKKYFSSLGKAAAGVAVHEGVRTLQGARELKLKNLGKPDEVLFTEEIHTDAKGRVTYQSKTDFKQGTVDSVTSQVHDVMDEGGKKRLGRIITRKGTSGHVIEPQVESGEKKGFGAQLKEAHAAGKKYELGEEAKNKKQEGMINAVGDYVTNTVLQPYPDVPMAVTTLSSAVSSFIPDKGIQFIPAVWETAVALVKRGKAEIDISRRLWGVIKNSPEAKGAKNNFEAVHRVVRSLLQKNINKMKTPEAQQAAAVFA